MIDYNNLSDKELLQLAIMERKTESCSQSLLNEFTTLPALIVQSDIHELIKVKGVGIHRANQLKAIQEISKRLYSKSYNSNTKISSPEDVANLLMPEMRYLAKEYFKIILLNTKNVVISIQTVSIGSLNSSLVHPRETFSIAIKQNAASIIAVHNHPSGDPKESQEDINITRRLHEVGKLIGIDLLDHIIIGDGTFVSLKEKGIL